MYSSAFICYSQSYSSDDLVLFQFFGIDDFFVISFTFDVANHTTNLASVVLPVMTSIIHYNFSAFDFY